MSSARSAVRGLPSTSPSMTTTVSAATPGSPSITAVSSLEMARRSTIASGPSLGFADSSTSGMRTNGSRPASCSKARRRGDPDANTKRLTSRAATVFYPPDTSASASAGGGVRSAGSSNQPTGSTTGFGPL